MPPNKSSPSPEVMTWRKAMPVLIVAGLFDLLRAFFNLFWFFGPALGALYCASKVSDVVGSLGGFTTAACTAIAAAAGATVSALTVPMGVMFADATGLLGFLSLGLWVVLSNMRLFKTAASAPLQFAGAFALGEVPFLGVIPTFFISLRKLYKAQIVAEQAAYKKWEEEQAALVAQMRQVEAEQAATQAQFAAQKAANDEQYAEEQARAANDEEIPEGVRTAA